MSLQLNKLSDAAIQSDIANNRERLEKFLAAPESSPMRSDRVRYTRRLADAALDLGLELYQQEGDLAEVRRYLGLAGKELLSILFIESEKAVLSPLEFEKALALAECFCPRSLYESINKVPVGKFFASPDSLKFYTVLAHYLDVLRLYLPTKKLNNEAWKHVESECLQTNASRYDSEVNLAKLKALKAVDTSDGDLLNTAIATLVRDHENEATRGDNQRSSRGFISLPALMYAHMGASRGLACTVKSPYLPNSLPNQ